jgi:large subunit ribosomal protein L1
MAKHSKRYEKHKKEVEDIQPQSVESAVKKLKGFGSTKFDQSVEVAMRLGIDPKQADQGVRGSVSLPHNIGKPVRVAVFAQGERAEAARQAGADIVGAEDLAEKVKGGFMDFDVCLASTDMMKVVGPLGRVLGPKGLMPTPKTGTMVDMNTDLTKVVQEFKAGKVEFRADATGIVHALVGKLSLSDEQLAANIEAFINHIRSVKPASIKGHYVRSITISATMSPGVPVIAA